MRILSIDRTLGLLLVVASLTQGCGYAAQSRDAVQPVAVPAMLQAQALNPEAGKNRKVVAGLDGNASKNVNESYAKSFQRSQAQVSGTESFQGLSGLSSD